MLDSDKLSSLLLNSIKCKKTSFITLALSGANTLDPTTVCQNDISSTSFLPNLTLSGLKQFFKIKIRNKIKLEYLPRFRL